MQWGSCLHLQPSHEPFLSASFAAARVACQQDAARSAKSLAALQAVF